MANQVSSGSTDRKPKSRKTIIIAVIGIISLCCIVSLIIGMIMNNTPEGKATLTSEAAIQQITQTEKAQPTNAPLPSETPAPTNPPPPTAVPLPTNTPGPTDTPTLAPTPIVLTGSGDSIVDLVKGSDPAIVHITGNASSGYFSVTSYDANGQMLNLLVNTTDSYDGLRPLDFMNDEHTTRFEVKASDAWTIEVLPLSSIEKLQIPGEKSGTGDYLFALSGGTPDLAKITGNSSAGYFGVYGYGDSINLLVNTTDPYDGTVMLSSDILIIEVQSTGEWTINITVR